MLALLNAHLIQRSLCGLQLGAIIETLNSEIDLVFFEISLDSGPSQRFEADEFDNSNHRFISYPYRPKTAKRLISSSLRLCVNILALGPFKPACKDEFEIDRLVGAESHDDRTKYEGDPICLPAVDFPVRA